MSDKTLAYCHYLSFYEGQFLSAYHHMLATSYEANPRSPVILEGITGSLAHLARSCESNLIESEASKYVSLALNALIENTYTCYEITTICMGDEISNVCTDPEKARHCINMDYSEFLKEHTQFKKLCREAKNEAGTKSDDGCKAAIKAYRDAIAIGKSLLDEIDRVKEEEFERDKRINEKISVLEEENSSKEKLIKLLTHQILQHPTRSISISFLLIAVIMFVIHSFFNTALEDFFEQMLFPHIRQWFFRILGNASSL